ELRGRWRFAAFASRRLARLSYLSMSVVGTKRTFTPILIMSAFRGQSGLFLIPTLPDLATGYDSSKVGMRVDRAEKIPRFPSYVSRVRFPSPAPTFSTLHQNSFRPYRSRHSQIRLRFRPRPLRRRLHSVHLQWQFF